MPYPLETIGDHSVADRNFLNLAKDMNPPVPQARVFNSANISITNNTPTALTFDSERWDNGSLHSTSANTSRLTAPIAGLYDIGGCAQFAVSSSGIRQVAIRVSGSTYVALHQDDTAATASQVWVATVSTQYQLAAGDYVELIVVQTSGGALNVNVAANYSPEFWMARLGGYVNQGV